MKHSVLHFKTCNVIKQSKDERDILESGEKDESGYSIKTP